MFRLGDRSRQYLRDNIQTTTPDDGVLTLGPANEADDG